MISMSEWDGVQFTIEIPARFIWGAKMIRCRINSNRRHRSKDAWSNCCAEIWSDEKLAAMMPEASGG